MPKVDRSDPEAVRAYNAQRMREWRQKNPEKELLNRLHTTQRRLERLRKNLAITAKNSTPERVEEG